MRKVTGPRAIIFDWDGVLVQSLGFIKNAFLATIQHIKPLVPVDIENLPTFSLRTYFPEIFGERAKEAEKIFYEYVETHHLQALQTTPGASELLAFLHVSSCPLFVVSNKRGELLRKEVDYLNWKEYFIGVLGAGDCAEDKPSRVPVDKALGLVGLQPSQDIWFVGDSVVDGECAAQSGCFFVFMDTKKNSSNNSNISADAVVFSCKDLKEKIIHNKV